MGKEKVVCPNCKSEIKSGMLSMNPLLTKEACALINFYNNQESEGYCNKCGSKLLDDAISKYKAEKSDLQEKLTSLLKHIPVISVHNPLNWDYQILGIVTGQSTTGTGVISEFGSSITDLFGMQSGFYNSKLKKGEDLCFAQIRKQTLDLGGNAIIALDIDYSEVGSLKGMLMVCMTGTAVRLKNPQVLEEGIQTHLSQIHEVNSRFMELSALKLPNLENSSY